MLLRPRSFGSFRSWLEQAERRCQASGTSRRSCGATEVSIARVGTAREPKVSVSAEIGQAVSRDPLYRGVTARAMRLVDLAKNSCSIRRGLDGAARSFCVVATMEACCGAHHLGRILSARDTQLGRCGLRLYGPTSLAVQAGRARAEWRLPSKASVHLPPDREPDAGALHYASTNITTTSVQSACRESKYLDSSALNCHLDSSK